MKFIPRHNTIENWKANDIILDKDEVILIFGPGKNYSMRVGDGKAKATKCRMISPFAYIEVDDSVNPPKIYLKKSKVLCMTSKWEGYGLVAVEALSLGKPVVATNVGGIPSIVNDECGKVTNNFDDMLIEINKLLDNENYYENKSINSYNRVKEINNVKQYINNIYNLYSKI